MESDNKHSKVHGDAVVELTWVQPIEADVIAARLRAVRHTSDGGCRLGVPVRDICRWSACLCAGRGCSTSGGSPRGRQRVTVGAPRKRPVPADPRRRWRPWYPDLAVVFVVGVRSRQFQRFIAQKVARRRSASTSWPPSMGMVAGKGKRVPARISECAFCSPNYRTSRMSEVTGGGAIRTRRHDARAGRKVFFSSTKWLTTVDHRRTVVFN